MSKNNLEIIIIRDDENPFLELIGKVADSEVKKLQKYLEEFCKRKCPTITLEMSKVTFMDSHGLGTIVYFHTIMQKEGRKLIIYNFNKDPAAYLTRLFTLTNLNKVLHIETNPKKAESVTN